ncbi:TIGR02452 family protein [Rhizosphaericola mali]|uniref:TIGR02452 family protein n=1 Tax=Rhizosphaericola mali TaxID=2545455 RepID=A0A5P2G5Z4_9BACT|nr:TIGR02452 family protein [Rhizosphaericola mali]QES90697.1 TIGR02452 family protein [Rhizosphaericola mali]
MNKKLLAQETLQILESGQYTNEQGTIISIKEELGHCIDKTAQFSSEQLATISQQNLERKFETNFTVQNQTTVAAIIEMQATHPANNIMCLNFASAKNPGGGFINGAEAQEESIARSSGLYASQMSQFSFYEMHRKMSSCVYTDSMIYSPGVPVFRNEKGVLIDAPNYCNIITSPAVNAGVVQKQEPNKANEITQSMHQRMDKMLALAYHEKNDSLILGAWGCGVFQNDPKTIGELFKELLFDKYKNVFKNVHFAVLTKNETILDCFKM